MAMTILYPVGEHLYVNLTNKCPCACTFCIRQNGDGAYGSDSLWLVPNFIRISQLLGLLSALAALVLYIFNARSIRAGCGPVFGRLPAGADQEDEAGESTEEPSTEESEEPSTEPDNPSTEANEESNETEH